LTHLFVIDVDLNTECVDALVAAKIIIKMHVTLQFTSNIFRRFTQYPFSKHIATCSNAHTNHASIKYSRIHRMSINSSTKHIHRSKLSLRRRFQHVITRTSEFWYEEEEEFDSLTDILTSKKIFILPLSNESDLETAHQILESIGNITAAWFYAHNHSTTQQQQQQQDSQLLPQQQLWAGRKESGPPYFKKLKYRTYNSINEMEVLWEEMLSQNWKVELDAGLGIENITPIEVLLLLVGTVEEARNMLRCANVATTDDDNDGTTRYLVVHVEECEGGTRWQDMKKKCN